MRPDQHVSSSGTWCRETSHDAQSRLHGGLYEYGGALQHDPGEQSGSRAWTSTARQHAGRGGGPLAVGEGRLRPYQRPDPRAGRPARGVERARPAGPGARRRPPAPARPACRRPRPAPGSPPPISCPSCSRSGSSRAIERGLDIEWQTADATALPFADASYDVVMSAIGAMFAPDQQATADELVRVCRPGGTIAMANWTPDGGAGRFFGVIAPYAPPPPPGPGPTAWSDPDHVAALFGDRVTDLVTEPDVVQVDFAGSADELAALYLESSRPSSRPWPAWRPGAAGGIRPRPDRVLPQRVRRRRCPVRLPARPGDRRLTQARDHSCSRQVWPTRSWPNEWCALESTSSKPAAS